MSAVRFTVGYLLAFAGLCAGATPEAEFFETNIRPSLVKNCYACHTASALSGLRVDSREALLKGGNSGPAIVPGKPEESLLIQAVQRTHTRFKMPPTAKMPDAEVASLVRWVKEGAVWPESPVAATKQETSEYKITKEQRSFWAFQPVLKPAVPDAGESTWPRTPIDRFILARLRQEGLKPVKEASRSSLIRRVTFDLTGFPPTPEEVAAFENDPSPNAFAKVVDRLLASPRYGERWARHWLDLARYSDGKLGASHDVPYPNAYRYRDWVIQAFNEDLPYDQFIKAQLAADLMTVPQRDKLLPALGFHALAPVEVAGVPVDDRVDVTSRVFLGLTAGCAQCHDHKFDPIPTKDYYSLLGVFKSSEMTEIPLAPKTEVDAYREAKKRVDQQRAQVDAFVEHQAEQIVELLMARTSDFLMAAHKVSSAKVPVRDAAQKLELDEETLGRWVEYLADRNKEHPYLSKWYEAVERKAPEAELRALADAFQQDVLSVHRDKKAVDDRNYVKLGGAEGAKDSRKKQFTNLEFLPAEKGYLWRDLASAPFSLVGDGINFDGGLYYYGRLPKRDPVSEEGVVAASGSGGPHRIERFLNGLWKTHYDLMQSRLARMKSELPKPYPFLHGMRDKSQPGNIRVHVRGEETNLGEEAPRRFFQVLCDSEPPLFSKGSGRLELAEAIASPTNPLTARVMVNRVWQLHFGNGIVRSTGNFGQLGERPTHPELLDYLAARLVEAGWSIKALHREILLSSVYALSTEIDAGNYAKDADNRLLWRFNPVQRLDAESLRDAMLSVSGLLDATAGGPPTPLSLASNHRRTVYGTIARTKTDMMLSVFDFPNPNQTSEERAVTVGPLQRLFFLNSDFMLRCSEALAKRLAVEEPSGDGARIERAYRLLFSRAPTPSELQLGLDYLKSQQNAWPLYAQALMASAEFSSLH
jgi:mono/diheme cytochrome c family protein